MSKTVEWRAADAKLAIPRHVVVKDHQGTWIAWRGGSVLVPSEDRVAGSAAAEGAIQAPLTAKVFKVIASVGDQVAEGDTLLILEAMKMEYRVVAPSAGVVTSLNAEEGAMVDRGQVLAEVSADEAS